ncbi:MAG: archaeosortase/exosortase family protein [Candidatus Bipolaricaulia bacterium]
MKARWSARTQGLRSGRLWLRLALCACVVALLVWTASADRVMAGIQGGLARVTGAILTGLGHGAVVEGNTVQTTLFGISVVTACTGLFITGLFIVAVIAYPARVLSKMIGVAIGIGSIFVLNIVRLVSLYFVGVHFPRFLDTVHLLVWQSLLIVCAVLLWLLWAGRCARIPRKGAG